MSRQVIISFIIYFREELIVTIPIIPIILCGGTGTRLWPLSRKSFPKQYLNFGDEKQKSLLQKTQERIKDIKNVKDPILICNEEHRFIIAEQMREIKVNPKNILLEPFGRNTAPAITLAAIKSIQDEEDPMLLVLSSDHEIKNQEKFIETINYGIDSAMNGKLVTFGIVPNSPETGYGYIESEIPFKKNQIIESNIKKFIEKPNLDKAKELILDKHYTWNSGIFLFKAKSILCEIKKFEPKLFEICSKSLEQENLDYDFQRIDKDIFQDCPNISIDIAVMERTKNGSVIPLDAGWSDIGNWNSIWKFSDKDSEGNVKYGRTITKDTKNCYLKSEETLIATIGIEDLIIIQTRDAILVSSKKNAEEVKEVVTALKNKGKYEALEHKKVFRPWGSYESIEEDIRWKVKLIKVKPGEKLSLQMHHHRAEHWIVVNGTAAVEIDQKRFLLSENQSTFIPSGAKHRLSNPGKLPLLLIEVQSGSYLGEDDIKRFEDSYGRL